MQKDTIISTVLAGASAVKTALQSVASRALTDAYSATIAYLQKKFGEASDAATALALATEKPESPARKEVLLEESEPYGLDNDEELHRLIEELGKHIPNAVVEQSVRVSGNRNQVQIAGHDLVVTQRHVTRYPITPDERHLTGDQAAQVRKSIGAVAAGMSENGQPNFAAVHRTIQDRFNVVTYSLIPRGEFESALAFLAQQRAIHQNRNSHAQPVAYRNSYYRAIYARARQLGWDTPRILRFAEEKLTLSKPLHTLKELGSQQLKTLRECMRSSKGRE